MKDHDELIFHVESLYVPDIVCIMKDEIKLDVTLTTKIMQFYGDETHVVTRLLFVLLQSIHPLV